MGMIDLHALDAALMDRAASYARLRSSGHLGPPQLHLLPRGALEDVRKQYMKKWTQEPPITWSQVGLLFLLEGCELMVVGF